jgi:septal ring factor EnvC (AmiA/AmiB activator)
VWGILKLGAPNYKKTVPAVIMIAAIRNRLEIERVEELSQKINEEKTLIINKEQQQKKMEESLEELKSLLRRIKHESIALKLRQVIENSKYI